MVVNEDQIREKAIETWGTVPQLVILFEEMSELQKAVCKYLRGKTGGTVEDITEEIADVEIMLHQLKLICNIDQADIDEWKDIKLSRTAARLEMGDRI